MKLLVSFLFICCSFFAVAQDSANYTSTEIVYARKDGMSLTMLKLQPKEKAKGKAIVSVVSGNWVSNYGMAASFTRRSGTFINGGYTVFLVFHSSQPRYAIPDAVDDVQRAIRFIRYNAKDYGIDPDHIGITGSSSGGHLSLMAALLDDNAKRDAKDPVDRVSARVQAAAVFYPPVDFLNWGNITPAVQKEMLRRTRTIAAFDFKRFNDTTGLYESVQGDDAVRKLAQAYSPIYSVSKDDPPVMIAHGDADIVVPLQQSQAIIQKLSETGIPNQLIIKPKAGHGWRNAEEEEQKFLAWFDKYLQ